MRKFGFLIMVMLTVAAVSFGAELCMPAPPPSVLVTSGPVSPDICSIGGLVFSNFNAVSAAGGALTNVSLVEATVIDSVVFLSFNPGLGSGQDIWFYFTVTGPLGGVDLAMSGVNGQSTEVVCSSPVIMEGIDKNNCLLGDQLARMSNVSGAPAVYSTFDQVNTAYIYKNIMVSGTGELSSLTQSFHVVPEPMSFVLIGTGLLGLGLLRRRASR